MTSKGNVLVGGLAAQSGHYQRLVDNDQNGPQVVPPSSIASEGWSRTLPERLVWPAPLTCLFCAQNIVTSPTCCRTQSTATPPTCLRQSLPPPLPPPLPVSSVCKALPPLSPVSVHKALLQEWAARVDVLQLLRRDILAWQLCVCAQGGEGGREGSAEYHGEG